MIEHLRFAVHDGMDYNFVRYWSVSVPRPLDFLEGGVFTPREIKQWRERQVVVAADLTKQLVEVLSARDNQPNFEAACALVQARLPKPKPKPVPRPKVSTEVVALGSVEVWLAHDCYATSSSVDNHLVHSDQVQFLNHRRNPQLHQLQKRLNLQSVGIHVEKGDDQQAVFRVTGSRDAIASFRT